MAKRTDLTKEELFNLVAPIHVYQKADLLYEKEAREAFRALKKGKEQELVVSYFGENHVIFKERTIKNADSLIFWKVYNRLFEEIVTAEFPELEADYDEYGAKCFRLNGQKYLDGDAYDCFPFYVDSEALKERLHDLEEEVA